MNLSEEESFRINCAIEKIIINLNQQRATPYLLRDSLIAFLTILRNGFDKKFIVTNPGLHEICTHPMPIVDSLALFDWFKRFSPIRFRPDYGSLKKISWSASYVKQRKQANMSIWAIEEANRTPWWIFYKEPTRSRCDQNAVREIHDCLTQSLIQNQAIADYLRRNPIKEEMGKFGVPQDKYRYHFYGHASMEVDQWRMEYRIKSTSD